MSQQSLLTLKSLTAEQISEILDIGVAQAFPENLLKGYKFAILFEKTSLRTKCSFEIGIHELGGFFSFIDWQKANFSKADLEDEIRVLADYYDCIISRVGSHKNMEIMNGASSVPVINALTDLYHPCQTLADLLTLKKHYTDLTEPKIVFVGPSTNVSNSLIIAGQLLGMNIHHLAPEDYKSNAELLLGFDNNTADFSVLKDADVIYTDAWLSVCDEHIDHQLVSKSSFYRVDHNLLKHCKKRVKFMHCMPISYGHEVTKEVLSEMDLLFYEQASNRIVAQKALLSWMFKQ